MIKTWRAYVIDEQGNVLDDLGVVSSYFSDYINNVPTFSAVTTDAQELSGALATMIDDNGQAGTTVALNPNFANGQEWFNQLKPFFPQMRQVWPSNTTFPCKIKLVSDSGYYAISITTFAREPAFTYTVSNWELYLDDDTSAGTINGASWGMPFAYTYAEIGAACVSYREDIYAGKYVFDTPTGNVDLRVEFLDLLHNPRWTITYNGQTQPTIDNRIVQWFSGVTGDDPSKDPFEEGGHSEGGVGGGGTFTDESEEVDFPELPSFSAADSGLITLFNPSAGQLRSLASYMWGSLFDISTFQKLFADPMDCILGLSIVPAVVPSGGSREVKVGNIGTGISMTTAGQQYVEVDCGSISVQPYWEAYLDYSPYTKAEIYLPYIGSRALNVDEIMGKTVHVKYHIDILSGACVAYVKCGDAVLYQFAGACATSVPVSGKDWTNAINGILSIAGAIGTTVATGGAAAPLAAGVAATSFNTMLKPNIERSGAVSGAAGLLGIQKPYLVLTRPRQCLPEQQNRFTGYPSFVSGYLGSMRGFTIVENVHLDNVPATQEEIDEIENLLKTGVIL